MTIHDTVCREIFDALGLKPKLNEIMQVKGILKKHLKEVVDSEDIREVDLRDAETVKREIQKVKKVWQD